MSVYATADVVVHFHKFRNIDLYARGVYAVRCSVTVDPSHPTSGQTAGDWSDPLSGIPYTLFSKAKSHSTFVRQQEIACDLQEPLPCARILDDAAVFQSRAFVIKYRDEYLELNEGVQFQLLIPVPDIAEPKAQRMKISVELMMAELERPDSISQAAASDQAPLAERLKSIAKQEFVVSVDPSWSVHEYFPATFDDLHFVQLDMSVHAAMINLKFRRRNARPTGPAAQRSTMARLTGVEPTSSATSFSELLFPADKYDKLEKAQYLGAMETATAAISEHYVQPMTDSMDCTTEAFRWLWDQCLPPNYRRMSDVELGFKSAGEDWGTWNSGKERQADDALPPFPELQWFRQTKSLHAVMKEAQESGLVTLTPGEAPSLEQMQHVVTKRVELGISQAAKYSFQLWSRFVALLPEAHDEVVRLLRPAWLTNARRLWFSRAKLEFRRAQKILQGEAASALSAESALLRRNVNQQGTVVREMMDVFDRKLLGNLDTLPICLFFKYVSYSDIRKVEDDELMRNAQANVPVHRTSSTGAAAAVTAPTPASTPSGESAGGVAAQNLNFGPHPNPRKRAGQRRGASLAPVVNTSTTESSRQASSQLSTRQFGKKGATRPLTPSSRSSSLPNSASVRRPAGTRVPGLNSRDDAALPRGALARPDPKTAQTTAGAPQETSGNFASQGGSAASTAASPTPNVTDNGSVVGGGGGGSGGDGGVGSGGASSFFSRLTAGVGLTTAPPTTSPTEVAEEYPAGSAPAAHPFSELLAGTNSTAPHVFVLHHGFHGSSYDLRLVRSYLMLLFPNALVLSSQVNEENSDVSIATMGKRLAAETRNFIMHKVPDMATVDFKGRLSFVGHSVGSVVIRAALQSPLLRVFANKMHAFISLSSPHLGNTYVPSAVVSVGMWALKRLRKAAVLDELQLLDAANPEDTLLYRLSLDRGLTNFKHVILLSGHQDQYVPLYSALMQVPRDAERDVQGGPTVISMAANLMGSLDPSRVIRMNMDHYFEQVTMDTLIGRAAHVTLLDSHSIIQMLLFSIYNVLQ